MITSKPLLSALLGVCLIFATSACEKRQGCTNIQALNYDKKANEDDGSCIYAGCMDPEAINYRPDASISSGDCEYYGSAGFYTTEDRVNQWNRVFEIYVDAKYIGRIQQACASIPEFCENGCVPLRMTELTLGRHGIRYDEIIQTSSTNFDTIFKSMESYFFVNERECQLVNVNF